VGNIDIVPTIAEFFGLPVNRLHQGESLVPLMLDSDTTWPRSYYMENKDGLVLGLVEGSDKIIYDVQADVFHRFDLAVDPKENVDRWGADPARDAELRSLLVRRNPAPLRTELMNPHTQSLLVQRLENSATTGADDSLTFLVKLAALQPNRPLVDAALQLFASTSDRDTRLLLLSELFDADPGRWGDALVRELTTVAGTAEELELVRALGEQAQPPFDPEFVADRITWWRSHGSSSDLLVWLAMLRNWRGLDGDPFFPVLEEILSDPPSDTTKGHPDLHALALQALGALDPPRGGRMARFATQASGFLESPSPLLQIRAAKVLGRLRAEDSVPALAAVARDGTRGVRVRQAALLAVVAIERKDAVPLVVELGDDPMLTVDAIDILRDLESSDGLRFLRRVQETHYNSLVRKRAEHAAQAIAGGD
jgi:HEAT repeat protein